MKILIAYDGSGWSDAALRDLERAALPSDLEAVVLAVSETWLPPSTLHDMFSPPEDPRWAADLEPASDLAARACAWLCRAFPGWDVRSTVTRGSPATEILRQAESWDPDLVVLGSHGHSTSSHFALGSVSQRVLAESACSVRVGRARATNRTDVRLMIGLDDSATAVAAVREVASRPWPQPAEVRLATVYDSRVGRPSEHDFELARVDQIHWVAEKLLHDAGLTTSRLAVSGNPKRLLPAHAAAWDADCVFLGSHGHGRLRRALLGSVAAAVAGHTRCSVEVIRDRTHR